MIDLLKSFSLSEILIFLITFILALKGGISVYDWFGERGFKFFQRKYEKPQVLEKTVEQLVASVNSLINKVDLLMQSDKDDIKAFIVHEHHYFCYQLGEIDYQSLQVIERRYSHYKEQGGNSYIRELMQELRTLPKTSDHTKTKQEYI